MCYAMTVVACCGGRWAGSVGVVVMHGKFRRLALLQELADIRWRAMTPFPNLAA